MKQVSTLLPALLFASLVFSQKNTIALDLRYLSVCGEAIVGGSFNYYRATLGERRLLGLKATWNTDALSTPTEDTRTHVVNLDVVNRWNFSDGAKVTWSLEAGVSGLWRIERTPPQPNWTDCVTGMTNEQIHQFSEYYSRWQTESDFLPGLAAGTTLEFAVARHISLGINLMANLYYSPEESCIVPYFSPALRTSFLF